MGRTWDPDEAGPAPPVLGPLGDAVEARVRKLSEESVLERIWRKDHTVWKPAPDEIADRLGWLALPQAMRGRTEELAGFADGAAADGFTHAVLLGMGGSSLAPEVLRRTFGVAPGALDLVVLDTTHPARIRAVSSALDPDRTLVVVASKSGTTIETASHLEYFWSRVRDGRRFVAITDPGTALERTARERDFRAVFLNPPDIGGRYSALSLFGLVPAALIGVDLGRLLDGAADMAARCIEPGESNPAAFLGALMGEAALAGRDKLTMVLPRRFTGFGAWAEQLIAESTGKEGKGILPVDAEHLGEPESYGSDRLFVVFGNEHPHRVERIERAGHPILHLAGEPEDIGAEFFRWELATAVAGHVLGINPFDQPNVAEAKEATAALLAAPAAPDPGFDDLGALLDRVRPGEYVAIQAFVDPTASNERVLQDARTAIRDRYRVATTIGFGPRYLHSTGQLHKGGPDTGVFIHVVDDAEREDDVPIPGKPYTFGALIDAQAAGDVRSLRARGRRVARVTLYHLEEVG